MKLQSVLRLAAVIFLVWAAFVVFLTEPSPKTHRSHLWIPIHYGLDIRGGVRAVLQANKAALPPGVPYNSDLVLQTLNKRINGSGVSEATVQPKGDDEFIIEIPEVHDKQAILTRLGTTAQMTLYNFQTVKSQHNTQGYVTTSVSPDSTGHDSYSFTDTLHNVT